MNCNVTFPNQEHATLSLSLTSPIPKAPQSIESFLGGKSLPRLVVKQRCQSLQQYAELRCPRKSRGGCSSSRDMNLSLQCQRWSSRTPPRSYRISSTSRRMAWESRRAARLIAAKRHLLVARRNLEWRVADLSFVHRIVGAVREPHPGKRPRTSARPY